LGSSGSPQESQVRAKGSGMGTSLGRGWRPTGGLCHDQSRIVERQRFAASLAMRRPRSAGGADSIRREISD